MYRFVIFSLLLLGAFAQPRKEITITSPPENTDVQPGQTIAVEWRTRGPVKSVDIATVTQDGTTVVVAKKHANSGNFQLVVPRRLDQILIADSQDANVNDRVTVRTHRGGGGGGDWERTLTITSPADNIELTTGVNLTVTWFTKGRIGTVDISTVTRDSRDGGEKGSTTVIARGHPNNGAYTLTVPRRLSAIIVADSQNASLSDRVPVITHRDGGGGGPPKALTITSPAPNTEVKVGQNLTITWFSRGFIRTVDIATIDRQAQSTVIAKGVPNNGAYTLVVGRGVDVVVISDSNDPNVNARLPVEAQRDWRGSLTITSPTANSTFKVGQSLTVTWFAKGRIRTVDISITGRGETHSIAKAVANNGAYTFNIPRRFRELIVADTNNIEVKGIVELNVNQF